MSLLISSNRAQVECFSNAQTYCEKPGIRPFEATLENGESPRKDGKTIFFGNSTRFLVLALSTLCLSLIMSNALALNFTIICMGSAENSSNSSDVENNNKYDFSPTEKSLFFSVIAVGTILGTIPITYLTSNIGVRKTFTAYGLVSAFATLATPLCFALSTSWPAMGSIISEWSTIRNSGMYIACLSCHLQLGPIFTMPLAGTLCESEWGWPAVYYLQGVLTLLAFLAFYLFFRDSPKFHRNVSDKELCKILEDKNFDSVSHKVPYKAMAKDITVWGIFASNLGGLLAFKYLCTALPYLISAMMKFVVGPFSDHMFCVSGKARVIIFATLSQLLMASCFVALSFLPPTYPLLIQACFTGATVFSGLNCVGVAKSTQLMSRQFSHVLMALSALTASIVVLLIPPGVSLLAPNNSTQEWSRIFLGIAVIVVVTIIIFDVTAEVDPRPGPTQKWTVPKKNR
uniref:Major facilitator superfamily (MFS) profile domain-containing protein n=1 Tax=Ditylenchus dipsaci TaxID=166011 RepID=A0A915CSJ0_9BILA